MRRFIALVALAGCALFEGPPPSLIGAWGLKTIDAEVGPPWTLAGDTMLYEDVVVIDAGHRSVVRRVFATQEAPETPMVRQCTGEWSIDEGEVIVALPDGCYDEGFAFGWSGGRVFQRTREGRAWRYRKVP